MDYTGITFGLDVLVSVIFGAGGAMGVYFTMKGKQDIMQVELDNFRMQATTEISSIKHDIIDIKDDVKTKDSILHKRIGELKDTVEKNRQSSESGQSDIKTEMGQMELRIITAIHEIKSK